MESIQENLILVEKRREMEGQILNRLKELGVTGNTRLLVKVDVGDGDGDGGVFL